MKLIRKVSSLEIKKCFAMTPYLRKAGIAGVRDKTIPTLKEYSAVLKKAKLAVDKAPESGLDKVRGLGTYKRRLKSYNTYTWHLAKLSTKEVGVWRRAGGLPTEWTRGSLAETAKFVKQGLLEKSPKIRMRAKRAIPAIISLKSLIQKDKYLLPIVFESGTGTNGRRRFPKTKYDIDDGNMRSIAFAVSGSKSLLAYVGTPPKLL